MQTEEETAAAEEPILEEGSDREQVNRMTFDLRPLAHVRTYLPTDLLAPANSCLVTRNSPVQLQHALVFTRASHFFFSVMRCACARAPRRTLAR